MRSALGAAGGIFGAMISRRLVRPFLLLLISSPALGAEPPDRDLQAIPAEVRALNLVDGKVSGFLNSRGAFYALAEELLARARAAQE